METNNKVGWLRREQVGESTGGEGMALSVSDNSGIVKIEIPGTGRRAPVLYRDEILFLLAHAQQITEYLNKNQDVAFSSDVSKESRKVKREQVRSQARAAQALSAFTPEQLIELAERLKQSKVG